MLYFRSSPNIGTSSKKRYQYFVPKAHQGTLEVASKDRNVLTKVGLSGNYETIQRIKRKMVNYHDAVPCRNSFSV